MSGRDDNNEAGGSGRDTSNPSNQGFGRPTNRGNSYHRKQTGGKPFEPKENKRSIF